MEEPNARIVRYEPHRRAGTGRHLDGVPPEGIGGAFDERRVQRGVARGVVFRAPDELELVAVQVERVFARVAVLEYDVNNLHVVHHNSVWAVGGSNSGIATKG